MKTIYNILLYRCINMIIMLFPSVLYTGVIMIDICFGMSCESIYWIGNIILLLLVFSILYGNTIIKIQVSENFNKFLFYYHKPYKMEWIESTIKGFLLVCIIVFAPVYIFLLYGIIQCVYIVLNERHLSICEKLNDKCYFYILKYKKKRTSEN